MKVEEFIEDWKAFRGKTYEFLETVPIDKMSWRSHKDLGTFGMQIRHIGVLQRAYINGIKSGEIDFHDGVYGIMNVDVETVLDWLLQHEAYHQGIFTCYGRLAGLGKFRLM